MQDDLVRLRPLQAEDRPAGFAVARDPELWQQHRSSDRHREPVFRQFFAGNLASGEVLVIEDRPTGHARLAPVPGRADAVETGDNFRSHRAKRQIGGLPVPAAGPLATLRKDAPDYTSYVILPAP
ncbi:GNAT family N-acetyltransferase [Neolewinella xylanilytica]|uniref:GNAT family N-acetyltransferase n=1 Tax=Neolewinella xylanilytica TaxID=1514080 RepID=UPI0011B00478|nr:GNAT family N-acetyltransferase [Neolewinella xylanilytica]